MRVKKLHPDAVIPKYAKPGDSGFDLEAIESVVINPFGKTIVKTGLAFEVPAGYELQVRPRSGVTTKTNLRVHLGTVDSGYRGEVGVIVDNIGGHKEIVPKGYRIAQGVVCPVQRVNLIESNVLSETDRDSNGFGSTGY